MSRSTTLSPSLPALYFHEKQATAIAKPLSLLSLPAETAQHCLTGFCDWGTLARISVVQSNWKGLVRDAANYGGHAAKWELAEALIDGSHGLSANPSLAIRYLKELAGASIDEGDGDVDVEIRRPQHGGERVCSAPFAPAMRKLASCYLTGTGVRKNNEAGLRWLKAAHSRGGDIDAAHELALIYEYGEYDVPNDVVVAAEWFLVAAKAGHAEAMAEYALCCELGCGVEQNDEDALEWYINAAQAGHINAKFSVGEAFEEARGVPQSDEEACLWYYKAAVEGDEDSKKALQRLRDIARIVLPGWESALAV